MKVTSYHPYSPRPGTVEKSGFSTAFFADEHLTAAQHAAVGNTDQLQISGTFPRTEIEKTAALQAQSLSQPADAGRLEELRAAVQSGSYHIPTDRIVDAMMGWRVL